MKKSIVKINTHINENIKSEENRINIALFHLLMIEKICGFIRSKLEINDDLVILPSENFEQSGLRPDFKVVKIINDTEIISAYIEVELGGEVVSQLSKYRNIMNNNEKLYSIVGKRTDIKDNNFSDSIISLEEIQSFVKEIYKNESFNQRFVSMQAFIEMVDEYVLIKNRKKSQERTQISKNTKNNPLYIKLREYFGKEILVEDNEMFDYGKILIDTTEDKNGIPTDGLSVKVKSRNKKVSIMSINSKNKNFVSIPNKFSMSDNEKGKKSIETYFLPRKHQYVDEYINLAKEHMVDEKNKSIIVPLDSIVKNAELFFEKIKNLI